LNLRNGYYTVGNEKFLSKTAALICATDTNTTPAWHFNNEVFDQVNWKQRPSQSLTELYHARARQLREQYDWLVLHYSGGSDSFTALKSMLDSGNPPDEVVTRWAISASCDRYQPNADPTSAENHPSEWDLVVKQDLEWLEKNHPSIKITVVDYSDDFATELTDQHWLSVNDHLQAGVFLRTRIMSEGERRAIDAGKRTAVVFGIDKPQLTIRDGQVYFYFLDVLANTRAALDDNRNCELFFWTPDMPSLVVAQAHAMLAYVCANPQVQRYLSFGERAWADKLQYDEIVKSVVYPDWNLGRFQVKKDPNLVLLAHDAWITRSLSGIRFYQSWEHGLKNIFSSVDPKYFRRLNNEIIGFNGFISPMYHVGNIDKLHNNLYNVNSTSR